MTSDPRDARIAELENQIAQLRLASVPENQRAAVQSQLEMEQERAAMAAERAQLNEAGRKIEATKLSIQTGISEEKLLEHESLSAMREFALQEVSSRDTEKIAAIIRGEQPGDQNHQKNQNQQQDPNANNAGGSGEQTPEGAAPGAAADPATTTPGSSGAQALGKDPVAEILDREDIGRGTGRVEDYLAAVRSNVPFEDVSLNPRGSAAPAPAPATAPPAPAQDQGGQQGQQGQQTQQTQQPAQTQ